MTKTGWKMSCAALLLFAAAAIPASAQTYKELISFDGTSAAGPEAPLTQGVDGSLYGTTYYGGTGTCLDYYGGVGCGVVFKITRHGTFKILYNFQKTGIFYPTNGLVLGNDGNLYGSTSSGTGSIFRITPSGTLTTLCTFDGTNGFTVSGPLVQGTDNNFYGVTSAGGQPSPSCPSGCGTVFRMTPAGAVTTLYSFCQQNYCPDGKAPAGTLAEGSDGVFYGTATQGGVYKLGTLFRITSNGVFSLLYTFAESDHYGPLGGLLLATNGNLYGSTFATIFQFAPDGVLTELPVDQQPNFPVQSTDGNFYDTGRGSGDIFKMTPSGAASTLYTFTGYPNDGSEPLANLVQDTDGKFYGDTFAGGGSPCNYAYYPGCGTVFSLDTGLGPFVAFVQAAGKVGQTGGILGQGFIGTTSVKVNGVPANFTVVSGTLIKATVPPGATTGYVTVTTPTGVLTSNVPFRVIH